MKMTGGTPVPVSTALYHKGCTSSCNLDVLQHCDLVCLHPGGNLLNLTFVSFLAPAFLDGSVERAEVTDLYAWMEYQFRIIATNEHGSGEASIPSLKIKTWDACKKRVLIFYLLFRKSAQLWDKHNPMTLFLFSSSGCSHWCGRLRR